MARSQSTLQTDRSGDNLDRNATPADDGYFHDLSWQSCSGSLCRTSPLRNLCLRRTSALDFFLRRNFSRRTKSAWEFPIDHQDLLSSFNYSVCGDRWPAYRSVHLISTARNPDGLLSGSNYMVNSLHADSTCAYNIAGTWLQYVDCCAKHKIPRRRDRSTHVNSALDVYVSGPLRRESRAIKVAENLRFKPPGWDPSKLSCVPVWRHSVRLAGAGDRNLHYI